MPSRQPYTHSWVVFLCIPWNTPPSCAFQNTLVREGPDGLECANSDLLFCLRFPIPSCFSHQRCHLLSDSPIRPTSRDIQTCHGGCATHSAVPITLASSMALLLQKIVDARSSRCQHRDILGWPLGLPRAGLASRTGCLCMFIYI